MTNEQRQAVLGVLAVLPAWNAWHYRIVTAIASALPTDVIDVLAARAQTAGLQAARPGWGLERAFNDHPAELVAWIQKATPSQGVQRLHWTRVWPVIAGRSSTDGAFTAISTVAVDGTAEELVFLAESFAQCENLALDQPNIVTEIIGALSRHPDTISQSVRGALIASGMPHGTSRTPGQPAKANVDNRDRAQALAANTDLTQEARDLYRDMYTALQKQIDEDLECDRREAEN